MEECQERREAELEFVASAYSSEEAWCEQNSHGIDVIHRRLDLPYYSNCSNSNGEGQSVIIPICLRLTLPSDYPVYAALEVDATIMDERNNNCRTPPHCKKAALNALPHLVSTCRHLIATTSTSTGTGTGTGTDEEKHQGEESVFLVLNQAEEWIQEEWPEYCKNTNAITQPETITSVDQPPAPLALAVLGRRLIYSHHIISKIKRADIKRLASDYSLTGYMRIGWPGLLILEGKDEDCTAFYDEIRPWQWKYLVVRGEQQETIMPHSSMDSQRRFSEFLQVEDMSVVAQHCRDVGLEALFRTSMKVYDNTTGEKNGTDESPSSSGGWYAALVHVDHMNDGKGYRKWLRKTTHDTDCHLLMKQCYKNQDYSKRPKILVGIVGVDRKDVSAFLKRWRTSRVDVDAQGKPCWERQMSVLVEGALTVLPNGDNHPNAIDWEHAMSEDNVTTSEEQLADLVAQVGGLTWSQAFASVLGSR
jgi:hypothetical protein